MSSDQPYGYSHSLKVLTEQEKIQRYEILKDLSVHIPQILLLQDVVNDNFKYSNKLLDDILFELNFVPQNKFLNKTQLKCYYEEILYIHNQYVQAVYELCKQSQTTTQDSSGSADVKESPAHPHLHPEHKHTHHGKNHHSHGNNHKHKHQKCEHHHNHIRYIAKQQSNSEEQQKSKSIRSQIVYDMNHISQSNLKEIEQALLKYALYDENLCKVLVQQILKKAWEVPEKAELFAQLCHFICKRNVQEFTFMKQKTQHQDNAFKFNLIESVQNSFDRATQSLSESLQKNESTFYSQRKRKLISKVIFVAELILRRVIKVKVMRYCIYHLLDSFLQHYYKFTQEKKLEDSIYEYYYEVVLYFIDHLGSKFDILDDKESRSKKECVIDLQKIKKQFEETLIENKAPRNELYEELHHLSGEDYLQLLQHNDQIFINKQFPEQSALLQKLLQRRANKWQKPSEKPYLHLNSMPIKKSQ